MMEFTEQQISLIDSRIANAIEDARHQDNERMFGRIAALELMVVELVRFLPQGLEQAAAIQIDERIKRNPYWCNEDVIAAWQIWQQYLWERATLQPPTALPPSNMLK